MKKKNAVLFITAVVVSVGFGLYAQNPAGKWVDANLKITLVLNADFTYSLAYPGGKSRGYWNGGGNSFCLRDASVATPVCYAVIAYSASEMILQDSGGARFHYRKQIGNAGSVPVGGRDSGDNAVVLSRRDGRVLTRGNFQTGLNLVQFIVGGKIRKSESRALEEKLVEEFQTAPAEVLGQLQGIEKAMRRVYQCTDPYRVGLVRQELFAAFHRQTRHIEETKKPLMLQVINRYVKVLAYDEQNNLLLTRADVDGYINCLVFNDQLAGINSEVSESVRREISAQLIRGFQTMPLERKRMLASSSLIWHLLQFNWDRLSPEQKNQYVQAYRNQIYSRFSGTQVQAENRSNAQGSYAEGSEKQNLAQMRRDFNARQNMFRMMQNMNTNTHALSLNIIENVGGTGNYWNVVDY